MKSGKKQAKIEHFDTYSLENICLQFGHVLWSANHPSIQT